MTVMSIICKYKCMSALMGSSMSKILYLSLLEHSPGDPAVLALEGPRFSFPVSYLLQDCWNPKGRVVGLGRVVDLGSNLLKLLQCLNFHKIWELDGMLVLLILTRVTDSQLLSHAQLISVYKFGKIRKSKFDLKGLQISKEVKCYLVH